MHAIALTLIAVGLANAGASPGAQTATPGGRSAEAARAVPSAPPVTPLPVAPVTSKAAPVPAQSIGYLDAATLARRCQGGAPADTSYCFAFITGVHDAARAYELWLGEREFCIPATVAQSDLRRAFLTYVAAYPQNRSGEAASVVIVALKETYPC